MSFFDVKIGADRIRVTAYNPASELTLAKCAFVAQRLWIQEFAEAEFRAWLALQPGGQRLLEQLQASGRTDPVDRDYLSIDPLNAAAETRAAMGIYQEELEKRKRCSSSKR